MGKLATARKVGLTAAFAQIGLAALLVLSLVSSGLSFFNSQVWWVVILGAGISLLELYAIWLISKGARETSIFRYYLFSVIASLFAGLPGVIFLLASGGLSTPITEAQVWTLIGVGVWSWIVGIIAAILQYYSFRDITDSIGVSQFKTSAGWSVAGSIIPKIGGLLGLVGFVYLVRGFWVLSDEDAVEGQPTSGLPPSYT